MAHHMVYRSYWDQQQKSSRPINNWLFLSSFSSPTYAYAYFNVILLVFPCLTCARETPLIESANQICTAGGYPMLNFIICKPYMLFSPVKVLLLKDVKLLNV